MDIQRTMSRTHRPGDAAEHRPASHHWGMRPSKYDWHMEMTRRQLLLGSIGGATAAIALLFGLSRLTQDFSKQAALLDVSGLRLTVVWLVVLGVGFAVVLLVSDRSPLVAAIPAFALGVLYASTPGLHLFGWEWLPPVVLEQVIFSFGPAPFLLVGVLLSATAWSVWRGRSDTTPLSPNGRVRAVLGSLGGVAIAMVLLFGHGRLGPDLLAYASFGETAQLRWTVLLLVLLGVVVGVGLALSKVNGMIAATTVVLLGIAYAAYPPLQLLGTAGWFPEPILRQVLVSSPAPFLIIGAFGFTGVWVLWQTLRSREVARVREAEDMSPSSESSPYP